MKNRQAKQARSFQLAILAAVLAIFSAAARADAEYVDSWGPSVGSVAPLLAAVDQDGQEQDLASLSGAKGLLLVFNRSVDW